MEKQELINNISLSNLDAASKSALIETLNSAKKYGLVWEDKPEEIEEKLRNHIPYLKEDTSKAIINGDEHPNHLIIEADNLQALNALAFTHAESIDLIYIDPPYNTRNKDFNYNDEFLDFENSYRHSTWLGFIGKRLTIAKKLLNKNGIIYISIDDNEVAQLKLLCNEIFGEENFIAQMIWEQGKKHIGKFIGINHEYILVYALNKIELQSISKKWKEKKKALDIIYKEFEDLKLSTFNDYLKIEKGMADFYTKHKEDKHISASRHYKRVDERGLFFPDNISQGTGNGPKYELLHPITQKPVTLPSGGYRYSYKTMEKLLKENRIFFGSDEKKVPCRKKYLKETEYELPSSVFYRDGRGASQELKDILGAKLFNNPKDKNELKRLFNFRKNNIILDFFAGSGSTLQAVMELNSEDGGNRQCILVSNSEISEKDKKKFIKEGKVLSTHLGISQRITYPRIKNIIDGFQTKNKINRGLPKNNLRYYISGSEQLLPIKKTLKAKKELARLATELICIKENVYVELSQLGSFTINKDVFRIFLQNNKYLALIYEENEIGKLVDLLKLNLPSETRMNIYVFSPTNYAFEEDFMQLGPLVSLIPLPDAIYEAYKAVNPIKKTKK